MNDKPSAEIGRLTHEMSNALAYVVTNLNLLTEAIEANPPNPEFRRLEALVADAMEGSERMGALLRSLRQLSWGDGLPTMTNAAEDTDPPASGSRILVIDDEEAILAAVQRALRPHQVDVATSGEAALDKFRQGVTYELVLCDLIMGGMSGMELYAALQKEAPAQADRVVFMTAGGFTPPMRRFLGEVRNSILHKPFDVKTLRWMVAQKLAENHIGG